MNTLKNLLYEFWKWTQLPEREWGKIDLSNLYIDFVDFPKIGEICDICINHINCTLTSEEMQMFLLCMAIDSEDEDILEACKKFANSVFLEKLISDGVFFLQSDTRWQIAELLRKNIPNRQNYLQILLSDPNEYVRKRTLYIINDIK